MATRRPTLEAQPSAPPPKEPEAPSLKETPPETPKDNAEETPAQKLSANLDTLATRVLQEAEKARRQVETNLVDHGLMQLQQAVEQLQTLARVSTGAAPAVAPFRVAEVPEKDCGCGERTRSCCIQLYISRVRVVKSQGLLEGDLELIFAVRALDQCGLLPSLSSYMSIAQFGASWVSAFAPIGKFCVPCNGTLVVPLVAEALETGGMFEGKPERGSSQNHIALRCNCDVSPVVLPVTLGGTLAAALNPKKAEVEIEVSGRRVEGGCCC